MLSENFQRLFLSICTQHRLYLSVVGIQLCISLTFVIALVLVYHYPLRIIGLSFLYICTLCIAQTMILLLLVTLIPVSRRRVLHNCTAITLGAISFFLLLLYLANIGSNAAWGSFVSGGLLLQAPQHIDALAEILQMPVALFYSALVVAFGLLCALASVCSPRVTKEIRSFHQNLVSKSPTVQRHAARWVILAVLTFSGFVGAYTTLTFAADGWADYQGEPFSALFISDDALFRNNAYLSAISRRDREIRSTYNHPEHRPEKNVILITSDSLRASFLPMYGWPRDSTPFLNSLFQEKKLIALNHVFATCPESVCGISSILASREYRNITPGLFKLNELLSDVGYSVRFILSGTHNWAGIREIYGNSIDYYIDGLSFESVTVNDDRGVLKALAAQPPKANQPAFFYIHLMSTHMLGRILMVKTGDTNIPLRSSEQTGFAVRPWFQKSVYEASVTQMDATIANIFSILDKKGYLKNSLVIITADHGESLGESGRYGHLQNVAHEALEIPLLIVDSEIDHYRQPVYVTQLDIAPTIVDRLGLVVPQSWQGRSLLQPNSDTNVTIHQTIGRPPTYAVYYSRGSHLYKLITQKFLPNHLDDTDALYELNQDPAEEQNRIATAPPDMLELLRERLVGYQRTQLAYWR